MERQLVINRELVEQGIVAEVQLHKFTAEASMLGWEPGFVARTLSTDLGNGLPFVLVHTEQEAFYYAQDYGCITLTVFND